jgi:hypothetical protein
LLIYFDGDTQAALLGQIMSDAQGAWRLVPCAAEDVAALLNIKAPRNWRTDRTDSPGLP